MYTSRYASMDLSTMLTCISTSQHYMGLGYLRRKATLVRLVGEMSVGGMFQAGQEVLSRCIRDMVLWIAKYQNTPQGKYTFYK